ncbi:MAG TPA: hypothetical protein VF912_10045 [Anaeromyxobacter sp.]
MSAVDLVIATAVLAAAAWLLWRSFRRGGSCHGCSGACGSAPRAAAGLVQLGREPRDGAR